MVDFGFYNGSIWTLAKRSKLYSEALRIPKATRGVAEFLQVQTHILLEDYFIKENWIFLRTPVDFRVRTGWTIECLSYPESNGYTLPSCTYAFMQTPILTYILGKSNGLWIFSRKSYNTVCSDRQGKQFYHALNISLLHKKYIYI